MKLSPGQKIGSYRVIRALGKGGMGEVYEVEHVRLGVHYALKTFVLDHGSVDLLKDRFLAEGKVLARLRHPGLARVVELDFDSASGLSYFVMDLVLGAKGEVRSLADVSPDDAEEPDLWRWFGQLCSALDYIHGKGIVHRDVKLGNVLVDADGNAVLSDFGISRYVDVGLRQQLGVGGVGVRGAEVTRQLVLGTDAYLAPEVRLGRGAVPTSDAYSLGISFFRLLTGVWFEPREGIFDLLEGLEPHWKLVLPPLLGDDPKSRPERLGRLVERPESVRMETKPRSRMKIYLWSAGIVLFSIWFGLVAWELYRMKAFDEKMYELDLLIEQKKNELKKAETPVFGQDMKKSQKTEVLPVTSGSRLR